MNRLIIMGSPRSHGRCAALAELLFDTYIEQYPYDAIFLAPISELTLDFLHKQLPNASAPLPLAGDAPELLAETSKPAETPLAETNVSAQTSVPPAHMEDSSAQYVSQQPVCAQHTQLDCAQLGFTQPDQSGSTQPVPVTSDPQQLDAYAYLFECSDDMKELYAQLNCADELIIVSPVYFSGAPAEFKVLLDRMQPYYLRNRALGVEKAAYKPAILHIVGEGGDPHGFKPLASEVKSAFSQAGFAVSRVLNWVGCISEDGSILHDPCDIEDAVFDGEPTHKPQSEHGCDSKNKRGFEQAHECECTGKRADELAGEYANEPTQESADELASAPTFVAAPTPASAHTRPKLSLSGDTPAHASQRTKRKATSSCSASNARTSFDTKGTARAKNTQRPAKKTHASNTSHAHDTSRTPRASKKGKNRG